MKAAIITLYTESMKDVGEIATNSHIEFAKKHDWTEDSILVEEEGCIWSKVAFISDYLRFSYDAILWVDADAMITNPELSIDWILDEDKNADVFLTADINGLNSGIMLIRNTDRSKAFFHAVTHYGRVLFGDRPNGEQQAIRHFSLAYPYEGIVHYLKNQRDLNSYYPNLYNYPGSELAHWQKGDFILHLPGTPNEKRIEIFNEVGKLL